MGTVVRTYSTAGTYTDTPPTGWTSCQAECFGGAAGTVTDLSGSGDCEASGGGGAYSLKNSITPVSGNVTVVVGAGGAVKNNSVNPNGNPGGDSSVAYNGSTMCLAKGGSANVGLTPGNGGAAASGIGDVKFSGGNGRVSTTGLGAAGGSSAGTAANGTNSSGQTTTVAPTGGGNGGAGSPTRNGTATAGSNPGGAGGAMALNASGGSGGGAPGGDGKVVLTYTTANGLFFRRANNSRIGSRSYS